MQLREPQDEVSLATLISLFYAAKIRIRSREKEPRMHSMGLELSLENSAQMLTFQQFSKKESIYGGKIKQW